MPAMNAVVRARIDEDVKAEAEVVLGQIGLTASDAFRLMMMRIVAEKKLPFEPLIPNRTTEAAMRAARIGRLSKPHSAKSFMGALNEETSD